MAEDTGAVPVPDQDKAAGAGKTEPARQAQAKPVEPGSQGPKQTNAGERS